MNPPQESTSEDIPLDSNWVQNYSNNGPVLNGFEPKYTKIYQLPVEMV